MLNLGFEENEAVSFKDHKGKITFLGILFFFFQKPTFFCYSSKCISERCQERNEAAKYFSEMPQRSGFMKNTML